MTGRRPTKRESLQAMALQTVSPEEAAIARKKLLGNELTVISNARQALEAATTLAEMKDIHDIAKTLQAGARARAMGIEAENMAADLIIRSERVMGLELIRMAETGERVTSGVIGGSAPGHQGGLAHPADGTTLADLGVSSNASRDWQRLARIPDPEFETLITQERNAQGLHGLPQRLSRISLVRTWFGTEKKAPTLTVTPTAEDGGFDMFRQGAYSLLCWRTGEDGVGGPTGSMLITLPDDELRQVAVLVKALAVAYNEEKGRRG